MPRIPTSSGAPIESLTPAPVSRISAAGIQERATGQLIQTITQVGGAIGQAAIQAQERRDEARRRDWVTTNRNAFQVSVSEKVRERKNQGIDENYSADVDRIMLDTMADVLDSTENAEWQNDFKVETDLFRRKTSALARNDFNIADAQRRVDNIFKVDSMVAKDAFNKATPDQVMLDIKRREVEKSEAVLDGEITAQSADKLNKQLLQNSAMSYVNGLVVAKKYDEAEDFLDSKHELNSGLSVDQTNAFRKKIQSGRTSLNNLNIARLKDEIKGAEQLAKEGDSSGLKLLSGLKVGDSKLQAEIDKTIRIYEPVAKVVEGMESMTSQEMSNLDLSPLKTAKLGDVAENRQAIQAVEQTKNDHLKRRKQDGFSYVKGIDQTLTREQALSEQKRLGIVNVRAISQTESNLMKGLLDAADTPKAKADVLNDFIMDMGSAESASLAIQNLVEDKSVGPEFAFAATVDGHVRDEAIRLTSKKVAEQIKTVFTNSVPDSKGEIRNINAEIQENMGEVSKAFKRAGNTSMSLGMINLVKTRAMDTMIKSGVPAREAVQGAFDLFSKQFDVVNNESSSAIVPARSNVKRETVESILDRSEDPKLHKLLNVSSVFVGDDAHFIPNKSNDGVYLMQEINGWSVIAKDKEGKVIDLKFSDMESINSQIPRSQRPVNPGRGRDI